MPKPTKGADALGDEHAPIKVISNDDPITPTDRRQAYDEFFRAFETKPVQQEIQMRQKLGPIEEIKLEFNNKSQFGRIKGTNRITIDPNDTVKILHNGRFVRASLARVYGHELGHIFYGPSQTQAIMFENRVASSLGEVSRDLPYLP